MKDLLFDGCGEWRGDGIVIKRIWCGKRLCNTVLGGTARKSTPQIIPAVMDNVT